MSTCPYILSKDDDICEQEYVMSHESVFSCIITKETMHLADNCTGPCLVYNLSKCRRDLYASGHSLVMLFPVYQVSTKKFLK